MASLMQKFKEMWSPAEDYYEDEYDESIENGGERRERRGFEDRVLSLKSQPKSKVVLTKPENFGEDIKNVADELLKRHTVVLNLEGVVKNESRRIIDFLSGVAYAIGGKIKRVSTDTFVLTPCNVEFEGSELLDEIESQGIYF